MLQHPVLALFERLLFHPVAEEDLSELPQAFFPAGPELTIDPGDAAWERTTCKAPVRNLEGKRRFTHAPFTFENRHAPVAESRFDRLDEIFPADERGRGAGRFVGEAAGCLSFRGA